MSQSQLRSPAPIRVIFDGQSMNEIPQPPYGIPNRLMSGYNIPWVEVGIGGHGWSELLPTIETRLYSQARNIAGCMDILIMNGGQGDILDIGMTGEEAYGEAVAYKNLALAAGFDRVLITTMPPMGPNMLDTGRPTPAEEQAINDHNTLVLANSGNFDAVVDLHVSPLDDPADGKHYYFDRLHLTPIGASVAAQLIRPSFEALLSFN